MKRFLVILLTFVLTVSLVGCGGSDKGSQNQPQDGEGEELSGTIVIWSWDVAAKALGEAADEFKKIHPKVEFQIEDLGNGQVYDKLTTRLASNTGLPDIVTVEGERVSTFVSKFPKGFVDLTNLVNPNDFLPVKMSEVTVNGKVMAFPWDGAPCGLFYREDLFKKAGINLEDIVTWDDFIEAGKKMNDIGIKMMPLAASKNSTVFGMIINELGTFYFDEEGKTILNNDKAIKAMTIIKKMYNAGITYDNVNWDGLVTATKESKIATVPSAVWWAGTLQDECADLNGKWKVMKLPVVEKGGLSAAVSGGSNVMVPFSAGNKRAAVEFVKFAMTDLKSQIKGFSKYGLYPSYISCYDDPVFEEEVEYFGGQKVWQFFTEIGMEIPQLNYTENYAEADSHVNDAQARILLKGADVKKTMNELQKTLVNKFEN